MSIEIFKETDQRGRTSGRIVAAMAKRSLPVPQDLHSWLLDASAVADKSLTAQVMREGYVLGVTVRER